MPGRAAVVAVANQKGGVAKTTTVACLGAAWAAARTPAWCWTASAPTTGCRC